MSNDMIADSVINILEHPFAIKWRISEESLKKASTSKDILQTAYFQARTIPEVQYCFTMDSNGENGKTNGRMWLYLHVKIGKEKKVVANYGAKIDSSGFKQKRTIKYVENQGFGCPLIFYEELFDDEMGCIVKGFLTLSLSGSFSVERVERKTRGSTSIPKITARKMLWNREYDKDFVVVVDGKEIKVHKCILGAHSSVFDRMFDSTMKEGIESKIVIKDFSFKIVEIALKLCYEVNLANLPPMENVLELLYFFDKYDIQDVKAQLEGLLINKISASNVCQLAGAASQTNCAILQKGCHQFLVDCLSKKIPVLHINRLDPDFAREVIQESLFSVFK